MGKSNSISSQYSAQKVSGVEIAHKFGIAASRLCSTQEISQPRGLFAAAAIFEIRPD
jgi:hypothetical protein